MKKLLCSISLLSGIFSWAQQEKDSSVQSKHIEEVIVSGLKNMQKKIRLHCKNAS